MKRLATVLVLMVAISGVSRAGLSIRVGTGIGTYIGDTEYINWDNTPRIMWPLLLDFSYSFQNRISLHFEGQIWLGELWDTGHGEEPVGGFRPVGGHGSILSSYNFQPKESLVRPYVLLGIGAGTSMVSIGGLDSLVFLSVVQFQAGVGVGFSIKPWLALGLESRLRISVPVNGGILGLAFFGVCEFKL